MSETKLDLDHLQAVAEATQKINLINPRIAKAPDAPASTRWGMTEVAPYEVEDKRYSEWLSPDVVLTLIEMAREGERLREVFEVVCHIGFEHCAKDAPVFDKIEAATGLDLRRYGWSVGQ